MVVLDYGRYYANKKQEWENMEWIILDRSEAGVLLLCRNCIDARLFHAKETAAVDWEHSDLRRWLNTVFLNTAFTIREKKLMIPMEIRTPDGRAISDMVTLMGAAEMEDYFPEAKYRRAKLTPYAKSIKDENGWAAYQEKGYCTWFLRDTSERIPGNYTSVSTDGSIDLTGGDVVLGGIHGIRPVIMVSDPWTGL